MRIFLFKKYEKNLKFGDVVFLYYLCREFMDDR